MQQTPFALRLDGLCKRLGSVQAVDHLSLEVRAGEIFGFLGPNGAGKTTTISMICGLLVPDSGSILFNGDRSTPGVPRDWIGVCPQQVMLWGRLTCQEQLEFSAEMYGVALAEARKRAGTLLEAFGLAEKRNRLASTLSGGMQRRLNLALALIHDPVLLVLDEPEAGLDPQSRVLVRGFLRAWAREKSGRTVIFTTHNMDEAERLVDRLVIIDHGRVLAQGTPWELKRSIGAGDVLEMSLPEDGSVPPNLRQGVADCLPVGAQLAWIDGGLQVRAPGVVDLIPAVLSALRQAGVVPGEVRLRENSLEDVFLALTGRRLRE